MRASDDARTGFGPRLLVWVLAANGTVVLAACDTDSGSDEKSSTKPSRTSTSTTTTRPEVTYQVKAGDTLTSIASDFGLSTATLAQANQLVNPDQLTEGQLLVIPPPPPTGVTIMPKRAHAGDALTLTLTGAKAGESVTFTIQGPSGRSFTGPPHTASPDGDVTAEYDSSGDRAGTYTVVAAGDLGTSVEARYRLLR
jgi:LysM repeat protein